VSADCFELNPSKFFSVVLIFLHFLTIIALYFATLPELSKWLLVVLILFNLIYLLRRYVWLKSPASWQSFSLEQNRIVLKFHAGNECAGIVLRSAVCTPYGVILAVKLEGRKWPISQVIFCDAMRAESFRALRVHLRFLSAS